MVFAMPDRVCGQTCCIATIRIGRCRDLSVVLRLLDVSKRRENIHILLLANHSDIARQCLCLGSYFGSVGPGSNFLIFGAERTTNTSSSATLYSDVAEAFVGRERYICGARGLVLKKQHRLITRPSLA